MRWILLLIPIFLAMACAGLAATGFGLLIKEEHDAALYRAPLSGRCTYFIGLGTATEYLANNRPQHCPLMSEAAVWVP
jgi:hypothetical protein